MSVGMRYRPMHEHYQSFGDTSVDMRLDKGTYMCIGMCRDACVDTGVDVHAISMVTGRCAARAYALTHRPRRAYEHVPDLSRSTGMLRPVCA